MSAVDSPSHSPSCDDSPLAFSNIYTNVNVWYISIYIGAQL